MRILVIGAGISGLTTAIELAKKNHQITVFEAHTTYGGKMAEFKLGQYRFDAGPSLFTQPQWLLQILQSPIKEEFSYVQLPHLCHYFFPNNLQFQAPADPQAFINQASITFQEPKERIQQYLQKYQKIYQITKPVFLESSLHQLKTYLSPSGLKGIANLWRIDNFRSMDKANKQFFKNPQLQQLFNRYATYNGSNPYQAPATLNVISQLEIFDGAYLPKNGMRDIAEILYKQACQLGVEFHFNTPVDEITYQNNHVTGVKTKENWIPFDSIVSNVDVKVTYQKLLNIAPPKKIQQAENSSSALIFYWGIKKQFPQLDVHNIFFSGDYKQEFQHLFESHTLYNDPTVYINITSKVCNKDAPEGCENWFVMINAPANYGQDWENFRQIARKNILKKLSTILKTPIEPLIEEEDYLDPIRIEQRTGSNRGSLYGSSSNHQMSAFFRQANQSSDFKNLYFCGGSVHPGGGIPLCIQSGKIVSSLFPNA